MNNKPVRPRIMGILNVTPDSFSDGGDFLDSRLAIEHGKRMVSEGADIIDIGGESTRPGAERIPASIQIDRVLPVVQALQGWVPAGIKLSIDTTLAEVAEAAINAGANMINDISAGREDSDIFQLAASRDVELVLMHMQGSPGTMQDNPQYQDVIVEIRDFLMERIERANSTGVEYRKIIIDPGLGFGKSFEHNLEIIRRLDELVNCGYPVLLGASRKRFLQILCNNTGTPELCGATCAVTAIGVNAGVSIFRVHDVKENRQAADVVYRVSSRI